jgi:hypothetical protein
MDEERLPADSQRLLTLAEKIHDKRYRDNYVAAHTRHILSRQMRNFRGDLPQSEFGELIGKRQTVVSRLENPNYGAWTLRTMFEVARELNVAVFVRFVDFSTFLKYSNDMSDRALHPKPYNKTETDRFAARESLITQYLPEPWFGSGTKVIGTLPAVDLESVTAQEDYPIFDGWTQITVTRGANQQITVNTKSISAPLAVNVANTLRSYAVGGWIVMSEEPETSRSGQPITIRASDHKIIYSDAFSTRVTSVDFSITFATQTLLPLADPQTHANVTINAIVEQFTVAMPLPVFKSIALHMSKILETIESEIGTIRVTANSVPTDALMTAVRQNLKNNPLIWKMWF